MRRSRARGLLIPAALLPAVVVLTAPFPAAVQAAMPPGMRTVLVRPLPSAAADFGVSAVPLGGDLLIAGYSEAEGKGRPLALRVGPSGDEVWRRVLPEPGDGAIWSLEPVGDGTFAGAGWSTSPAGDLDAMLLRLGADGTLLWRKTYAGPGRERLWSLAVTPRGFLAAGETLAADGTSKMLVLRTDLDGREIARFSPAGAPVERAFSVQALPDGGWALSGQSGSGPKEGPGYDAKVIRCDAAGRLVWSRTWGGKGFDVGHDLRRLDDGFLVAGYTDAGGDRGAEVFLLKLSEEGEVLWSRTDGGPGDDRAVHLELLPDREIAVAGYSRAGTQGWDIVLRVFSPDGEPRWAQRFGGTGDELARTIVAFPDGGLTLVGHSRSYGPTERILLVRLHRGGPA